VSVLLIAASSVVIVAVDLSGDGRQMIVNTQTRLTYTSGRLWSQSECQRLVNPGRHVRTLTDRHTDTQTYRQRDRLSERISRKNTAVSNSAANTTGRLQYKQNIHKK